VCRVPVDLLRARWEVGRWKNALDWRPQAIIV
jgi:hypothetical protein